MPKIAQVICQIFHSISRLDRFVQTSGESVSQRKDKANQLLFEIRENKKVSFRTGTTAQNAQRCSSKESYLV